MSIEEQFRTMLKLQQEIDEKVDQFIELVKAVPERNNRRTIVELDGEIYELRKVGLTTQAIDLCRKHNGFLHDYRLVCLGKPLK
jgi:hypothetical protein